MRRAQFNRGCLLVLFFAFTFGADAQQPRTPLQPYGNTQVNYVRTWDMVAPETVSSAIGRDRRAARENDNAVP